MKNELHCTRAPAPADAWRSASPSPPTAAHAQDRRRRRRRRAARRRRPSRRTARTAARADGAAPPPQPRRDPALSRGRPGAQRRSRQRRRDADLHQRRRRRGRAASQTRRVTAQMSYRYERNIEWSGDVRRPATSIPASPWSTRRSCPGVLSLDAGALATRTGGEGRALGVTNRDEAVNVYAAYAGPTLSTHAGPVAINASYRLGYVKIDDDRDRRQSRRRFRQQRRPQRHRQRRHGAGRGCRSAGPSAAAMPARIRAAASTSGSRAPMSAPTWSCRSAPRSR